MATRGRKPKPAPKSQPLSAVAPPADVAGRPAAVDVWHETVASLQRLGLWNKADTPVVARYAVLRAMRASCVKACEADGLSVRYPSGHVAPTVAATMLVKLGQQLASIEGSMGLTTRARQRMRLATPAEDDNDDILRRFTSGGTVDDHELQLLAAE